jgi:predicted Rossmann-fold nucleotide-binding protein
VTWAQLGLHAKPIFLVDADGYWVRLLEWVDGAVARGYVTTASRRLLQVTELADVVGALRSDG